MAFIDIDNISVDFPIYHGSSRSLKKTMFAAASSRIGNPNSRLGQDRQQRMVVQALRDVSFKLRPGDRLALVGGNGAGKTTLLRVLAGIYEPVSGHVHIEGKISTLLDAGLGMNPDLSGRENIALRGYYNGMTPGEIANLADDVADFAELGEFLELPVRFYSSGMSVRLAFAMATAIHPQVLLMDEWMLAGDANFLDKAKARIEAFVSKAEILVLSTHVEEIVLKWATRVIWLDQGRVKADGPAEEVMAQYLGRPPHVPTEPDMATVI